MCIPYMSNICCKWTSVPYSWSSFYIQMSVWFNQTYPRSVLCGVCYVSVTWDEWPSVIDEGHRGDMDDSDHSPGNRGYLSSVSFHLPGASSSCCTHLLFIPACVWDVTNHLNNLLILDLISEIHLSVLRWPLPLARANFTQTQWMAATILTLT